MPVVPPWRRWSATAEASRRRNQSSTYTEPLGMRSAESNDDGFELIKNFMSSFYKIYYTKEGRRMRQEVLRMHPEVAAHFAALVKTETTKDDSSSSAAIERDVVISDEEFWQRYLYRCDVDRILAEWERNPPGRVVGGGNPDEGMRGWFDRSVGAVRDALDGVGGPAPDSSALPAAASTATPALQKEEDNERKVELPDSSVVQKLDASLNAALKDVANWTMQDDAQVQMPKKEESEKKKAVTASNDKGTSCAERGSGNWFERLVRPPVAVGNASTSEKQRREESSARDNSLPINSPAQSLLYVEQNMPPASGSRAHQKAETINSPTKYKCDDFSFALPKEYDERNLSSKPNPPRLRKEAARHREKNPAEGKGQEECRKDVNLASSKVPLLANIKGRFAKHEKNMPVIVVASLLAGFLAHMIVRWSVDAFCASSYAHSIGMPSRWWSPSGVKSNTVGLICGDNKSPQMAVELFDSSNVHSTARAGRIMKGEDAHYAQYWMQNADFSQYIDGGGGTAYRRKKMKKKDRGIIGFFRRRFGRKTKMIAQQADVKHNQVVHVHHVVHHVVHEESR